MTGPAVAGPVVCPGGFCVDAMANLYGSCGSTWYRCLYLTKILGDFYAFLKAVHSCSRIF